MVAFTIPQQCTRCGKKGKLSMLNLPVKSRGKGKSIILAYTPIFYICKSCIKSLSNWVEMETKGMKSLREGFLDLMSMGKVILKTRFGNLWWVKK